MTDAEEFEEESFELSNDEFDEWYAAQKGNESYPTDSGTFAVNKLFRITSRPITEEDKFWLGIQ